MQLVTRKMAPLCLASGILAVTVVSAMGGEPSAGVTRIAKPRQAAAPVSVQQTGFSDWVDGAADRLDTFNERVYGAPEPSQPAEPREPFRFAGFGSRTQAPEMVMEGEWIANGPDGTCDCPECQKKWGKRWGFKHGHGHHCHHCDVHHGGWPCHACGYNTGYDVCNYFHSKFGYFCPSGAGGAGSPFFGKYARVYPQDVNYFDGRDGQLYAAQGYGAPMAVPLAPVVGHTYNYGWGIPSSRLTPISHHAYR